MKEQFSIVIIKFKVKVQAIRIKMSLFGYETTLNSEIYALAPVPISSPYNYPILHQLISSHQILKAQMNLMKDHISSLKSELQSVRQLYLNECLRKSCDKWSNGQKSKKIFKKDKNCPFQDCDKKYSSRIALNAHLRKRHGRKVQKK